MLWFTPFSDRLENTGKPQIPTLRRDIPIASGITPSRSFLAVEKLEWKSTFNLGVKEIDDEHKNLFALTKEIRKATERRDFDLCKTKVDEFINASEKHFASEEDFLARAGFPAIKQHKAYHSALLTEARELKKLCDAERDRGQMESCYDRVIRFLIDDVIRGDSAFKSYLDYFGYKDTKPD